jgi:transcriptional regulator with XRE-family HTH domain
MAKKSSIHAGSETLTLLGAEVRKARAVRGLSQEGLAVDAVLDRSYLSGIELGKHNLTLMNLVKLAAALGVRPSELLERSGL